MIFNTEDTEVYRATTGESFYRKSFVPSCLRVRKIGVKKNLRVLCVTSVTSVLEKGATLFYKKESAA